MPQYFSASAIAFFSFLTIPIGSILMYADAFNRYLLSNTALALKNAVG
jgi:hypothetical protein